MARDFDRIFHRPDEPRVDGAHQREVENPLGLGAA
jgi:hypothetical protein